VIASGPASLILARLKGLIRSADGWPAECPSYGRSKNIGRDGCP
jgi:hypothetical protein